VLYRFGHARNECAIGEGCFQKENIFDTFAVMNIIVKRAVLFYVDKYPQAKTALLVWYNEFLKQEFHTFNELKNVYGNASIVANNRVIFNIKGNDYRLIVSVNFKQLATYIIWFGTHKEYDKINVETIEFDTKILNYKVK
jgi:mRNA interferase HigB